MSRSQTEELLAVLWLIAYFNADVAWLRLFCGLMAGWSLMGAIVLSWQDRPRLKK